MPDFLSFFVNILGAFDLIFKIEPDGNETKMKSTSLQANKIEKEKCHELLRSSEDWGNIKYLHSARGNKLLYYLGHRYIKNNIYGASVYWKCTKWHAGCRSRAITNLFDPTMCVLKNVHNHETDRRLMPSADEQ